MNETIAMLKSGLIPDSQYDNERFIKLSVIPRVKKYVEAAIMMSVEVETKRIQSYLFSEGISLPIEKIDRILISDEELWKMIDDQAKKSGVPF
jgi:hypothetical protein